MRRNSARSLAAAAVSILVGLVVIVAGCSSDSTDSDDGSSTSASPDSADSTADPNIVIAHDMAASWSENDAAGFWAYFADDGTFEGDPADDASLRSYLGFFMALGDTVTIDECATSVIPNRVTCDARGVDDLSGPAGAAWGGAWIFDFEAGEVTSLKMLPNDQSKIFFIDRMAQWIQDEHPGVWETVFVDPDCSPARIDCYGTWSASPEVAAAMLELGPEYIASLDS